METKMIWVYNVQLINPHPWVANAHYKFFTLLALEHKASTITSTRVEFRCREQRNAFYSAYKAHYGCKYLLTSQSTKRVFA